MDIEAAFRMFDIRGKYPGEVDERLAFLLGKALTALRKPKKVLLGSDTRESSPGLKKFLIDGFSAGKVAVFDLFEVPVPEFYFSVATGDFDLGVMITASHISADENGFKLVDSNSLPFDQEEILKVKSLVGQLENNPILVPKVEATRLNKTEDYITAITNLLPRDRFRTKVVLDVTESAVAVPVNDLFSRLGINFTLVKSLSSGNPLLPQNRVNLAKAVRENKADLGIIWDSDGDRVVFVDRQGQLVPLPFVLGILAAGEIRNSTSGRKIAVDVRAGLVVRDLVEEAGGTLEVLPAWSQNIKYSMQEDPEVIFGGETSGHFVFRSFHCIDDGVLASLKFLALWESTPLEEKLAALAKKYFELPEKNFPCPPAKAPEILEKLSEFYRKMDYPISIKDGLTVFGPDFKFNLRSSLTEPYLRLNLETRSLAQADNIIHELERHLLV
ncbi:hypothetical protein M1403_00765 [Patescibacteria group bacterium]|nr:hypothetical protein [Patescibacteria group bacterium]